MSIQALRSSRVLALVALTLLPIGCGGGGGGGGGGSELQIVGVNLPPNYVGWELNRAIRITFDDPLDPSTVNTNTINVREPSGVPAFGTPSVDPNDPKTVIWRPDCPTLDDLSDAGLKPARTYVLSIIGASANAGFTVRSRDGGVLELSDTRSFSTPNSALFSDLFVDDVVGPPVPVLRPAGSLLADATYVQVNGVQHYFERQANGSVALNPPLTLPLNLLSDPTSHVELFVQFNQSVDMRSSNIDSSRIGWEFESTPGVWTQITAEVTLESNCTESGAVVRLTPEGLLPPSSPLSAELTQMRVVVAPEFRDIVSEQNLLPQVDFAPMETELAPSPLADNLLEEFNNSLREDATAPFAEPHADWNQQGTLQAKFSFTGNGGPGGDFDWKIGSGQVVLLNTINTTIQGGPQFSQAKSQTVIGGVVDVRNLWVEAGGILICDGPNPVRIFASGDVLIEGTIDISGNNSPGVNTLNTTNISEPGGPGRCGGGRGGTGNPLTTSSSLRGGNGTGAFDQLDLGGQGGETGWSSGAPKDERRGGGGGGGRFGENVVQSGQLFVQSQIGMDGEDGFDNLAAANSAVTGAGAAHGGKLGPSPFVDNDNTNNFYGTMLDTVTGQLILGELKKPWAGSGGGAGGNASKVPAGQTFPPPFNPQGDEKGAGGGGGGGSFELLALGDITFGAAGQILCRGGTGGGGENTIFIDRVGGGSGGGSGGHVILQTAGVIDFTASGTNAAILATGGQGGAGKDDKGGAFRAQSGMKETPAGKDACPTSQMAGGCIGHIDGAGGDGSPGLIQLHTAGGLIGGDILLGGGATLASVCRPPPVCQLGAGVAPGSCYTVPTFGRLSRARSQWVALGNGGFDDATGQFKDVQFLFGGTDTLTGDVLREPSGTEVLGLPPILTASNVAPVGHTLQLDATAMVGGPDAFYLQAPELLRHFLVELYEASDPTNFQRFDVASASFDSGTNLLTLDLDPNGPALESFAAAGAINAELQPAYFRVVTEGVPDSLPASSNVSIFLSATTADSQGDPELIYGVNADEPKVNGVADVAALNVLPNNDLRFVRFEVLFDIDALISGLSPSSPIPALEFFRLGFKY